MVHMALYREGGARGAFLKVEVLGVARLELAVNLPATPLHLCLVRPEVEGGLARLARDCGNTREGMITIILVRDRGFHTTCTPCDCRRAARLHGVSRWI